MAPRSRPDQASSLACHAPGWHPEDVKAALRKRFGSLHALTIEWGIDKSSISQVLRRPDKSARVERLIAAALGVAPYTIWPDRWTEQGERLPRAPLPIPAPGRASRSTQKREAA